MISLINFLKRLRFSTEAVTVEATTTCGDFCTALDIAFETAPPRFVTVVVEDAAPEDPLEHPTRPKLTPDATTPNNTRLIISVLQNVKTG